MKLKILPAILFPLFSTAQRDTLTNAIALRNTFELIPTTGYVQGYGVMNNGDVYGMGLDMKFNTNGGALPIQFTKIDYTTKTVTKKEVTGSTSSILGVYWRHVQDSLGRMIFGGNTANRYTIRFNLKDSIEYLKIGDILGNDGLNYSMNLNANREITIGGSSSITSTRIARLREDGTWVRYSEVDPSQGYTYAPCIWGGYMYCWVGQNDYKLYAIDTLTDTKTLISTSTFFFDLNPFTNGDYFRRQVPYEDIKRLTDNTAETIPPAASPASLVVYQEVNSAGKPTISSVFDNEHSVIYFTKDGVYDSMAIATDSIRDGISRVLTSGSKIYYTASYYGGLYEYDTLTQVRTFLGNPGCNVYSMLQYNDSIIYIAGYPSAELLEWNINQAWTVGKIVNGVKTPASSTSNPKHILYWRTETDGKFHHPNKLVECPNGVIASAGDIIRTATSASFGTYNPSTGEKWGYDGDKMINEAYSDLTTWNNNILFSTNNGNGGIPKLYISNSITHVTDSLDFGFHNYGNIFVIGDLLLGVAQDTSNPTHSIDSVRFYKVNLSTGELAYNKKIRATLNTAQWMADGYIGINMTYTDGIIVPYPVAPPTDFWVTRTIQAKSYYYNGDGNYIYIENSLIEEKVTNNPSVNPNTAEGKQEILINMLR